MMALGERKRADAVFEGGGVKGIALIGAASVIEEAGYAFHNLAGTSAGAIVATLLAAGYSADELKPILMGIDFEKFKDSASFLNRIPLAGNYLTILKEMGIYKGDYFLDLMRRLLADRGVKTFRDLVLPDETEPRYRFKAHVIASDISRGNMVVLPADAPAYGIDPEELEVALAVRMSMSIPYFFKPVDLKNTLGQTCVIVDGGLLSNFPIELFDTPPPAVPPWPTFGFALVHSGAAGVAEERVEYTFRGPLGMLYAMFNTAMVAHDAYYASQPDVSARTVKIDGLGVSATDFSLSTARKEALYQSGRAAARAFLDGWDFSRYIATFRTSAPETRRQAALAQPSTEAPTVP